MKKDDIIELTIEDLGIDGEGIGKADGMALFVKDAVVGDRIRAKIMKMKKNYGYARLLEVLEPSPLETRKPVCSIFPQCGGCMYQTMDYSHQLEMKQEQIRRLLDTAIKNGGQVDENGNPDYVFEGIKGSPTEFRYRNKMEFSFGDAEKDGPLTLGLHKKGSTYDVLTASDCKLVHEDLTKILTCVLDYCKEQGFTYYHKMRHEGYLRHLLLRRGNTTGEILINLVTTTQLDPDLSELVERLLALPLEGTIVGILHILNDSLADLVQSDETRVLYGQDYFYENLLGLKFKITPFSFFQPNSLGAEVLYETARSYIGDTRDMTVFDLYSGTGTIAQILAPAAEHVTGVEIIEEAVEAAKVNAAQNGLTNCDFIAGDVLKVLDTLEERPDLIVLDPPRDGIHPKALPKIIDHYGCEKMIYISCKPTSLARDLVVLQAKGYEVTRVCCVDMFPGTTQVETVVLLSRKTPDDTIEVDLDLDELDITAAESKATYQEIKDYVLKEFGLKVSTLYISQIKRKCGIDVGEHYNISQKENQKVPQCPKEKKDAIRAALEHFAMI